MAEDFNQPWIEQQMASETQRHTNLAEAAKRAQERSQHHPSSKSHSEIWGRLYPIVRVVIPAIAVVGLVIMVGLCRLDGCVIRLIRIREPWSTAEPRVVDVAEGGATMVELDTNHIVDRSQRHGQ